MGCIQTKDKKSKYQVQRRVTIGMSRQFKVQCKICFEEYNLTTKTPLTLPCFHSLCLQCVEKLPKKQCPFDHKPFKEYGKNFELINTIQNYQGKKIKNKKQQSQIKPIESPTKKKFIFKNDLEPGVQIHSEPRRVNDIDANLPRLRPPVRIFAPKRQGQSPARLMNPQANQCAGSHKFSLLSYQVRCNVCGKNDRCSQCNICRSRSCISCHKIDFGPDKCPNNHPTKWSKNLHKCTQCTQLQSGKICLMCSYKLCDDCCRTTFTKTCPNKHQTRQVSYKDKCIKCKLFARGFHCVSCSYHFCQYCQKVKFKQNLCPNNHPTVARIIRSTCTKCQSIQAGKSCTVCLYHICDKCK